MSSDVSLIECRMLVAFQEITFNEYFLCERDEY